MAKIKSPGKYAGGKQYLATRIVELHPPISTYDKHIEPYGGLASVKLNLPSATRKNPRIDIYNDIDNRLVTFFLVLRDKPTEFQERLALTPYSEKIFDIASNPMEDPVLNAIHMFVRMQQSIGGRMEHWSQTRTRTRRGIADVVSGYLSKIHNDLPAIIQRVSEWQIECRDAIECMKYHDSSTAVIYLDPPYVPTTRSNTTMYAHEMTTLDHERLLQYLTSGSVRSKVLLSCYDCELYKQYLHNWRKHSFNIANHAAGGKSKRRMEEVIYMNWEL